MVAGVSEFVESGAEGWTWLVHPPIVEKFEGLST